MRTYVDPDSTRDSVAVPTDSPPASGAALLNGGFPEPPPGAPVRIVRAEHDACGTSTRVRLPSQLPPAAVRRVVCQACAQRYDAPRVEEVELIEPPSRPRRLGLPALPGWLRDPHSRAFRVLALVVGAAAVIGALALIQGSGDSGGTSAASPAKEAGASAGAGGSGSENKPRDGAADLVRGSSFSLALPPGWQRTNPPSGATFAAAAPGHEADVTLWVRRDPELAFADFQANSLERLRSLAGSAEVVDQVAGPSADDTIVTLAADAPPGSPEYEVTLRASGPHRYYLATTLQSDAGSAATGGVDLIQGSFVPTGAGS
jgi:hypothetical protein